MMSGNRQGITKARPGLKTSDSHRNLIHLGGNHKWDAIQVSAQVFAEKVGHLEKGIFLGFDIDILSLASMQSYLTFDCRKVFILIPPCDAVREEKKYFGGS